jgi:predicted DNA-binding transcriptional regulator
MDIIMSTASTEMDKLQHSLNKIGLTEHESAVYLASLELGPSAVLAISRRAGIKRTTVYSVVDALIARGLMRSELDGLKTVFAAEDPQNLVRVMESRQRELDKSLPDLALLFQQQGKSDTIKRYSGSEGLKTIYETIYASFRRGDPYYVIGGGKGWVDIDSEYQDKMLIKKSRVGVDTRLLMQDSERAAMHMRKAEQLRQEVRLLPHDLGVSSDILITKDRVAIMHLTHPYFGIVIENPDVVHTYLAVFKYLWALTYK